MGIQDFQKTEFPQFKSFAGSLIGTARTRHDFALQGLRFNDQRLQTLLILRYLRAQTKLGSTKFVACLVGSLLRLKHIALVTVEDREGN